MSHEVVQIPTYGNTDPLIYYYIVVRAYLSILYFLQIFFLQNMTSRAIFGARIEPWKNDLHHIYIYNLQSTYRTYLISASLTPQEKHSTKTISSLF